MSVYLRAKFHVSSITLTSFRLGGGPPISKRTPKKPTQIRVNKEKVFHDYDSDDEFCDSENSDFNRE